MPINRTVICGTAIVLVFFLTTCSKEKLVVPNLPAYGNPQGDHQSGYFLEPLEHPVTVDITLSTIHKVQFVVSKGGGTVLVEEFLKGKTYFRYDRDTTDMNDYRRTFVFEINSAHPTVTLSNKWLLGCEAENELTVYLFGENARVPVDTLIYTAVAKKREIWNRACGLNVFIKPYDYYPETFTLAGGNLYLHPNGDIWLLKTYPVYRSTDQGRSFMPLENELLQKEIYSNKDAAISPTGRIFVGTSSNGIIVSDDNGATWRYSNQGIDGAQSINRFIFLSDTEYLCNSANQIFYSANGGDSWTPLKVNYDSFSRAERCTCAVKVDNTILMVDDWRNLLRSDDQGKTWENLTRRGKIHTDLRALVKFGDAVYIVTEFNGKYHISKSLDKGLNWIKVYENDVYTIVNTNNLQHPSRLFYSVDWPGNPLYDAKNIYYIDANGEKGTLIDSIPDIGFYDFMVLPSGKMVLSPPMGGVFYNE